METRVETSVSSERLIGSYAMNDIIKRVESDEDKVALVDLWTVAHAFKRELNTLRRLIDALPRDNSLPY
jgi:hypothetical protein